MRTKSGSLIPLFRPARLKGKYLRGVLASRHLTTGPVVEELRAALAAHWDVDPYQVALANSATACLIEILDDWASGAEFIGPTWPPLRWLLPSGSPRLPILTDIGGGSARPGESWYIHDACHTASILPKAPYGVVSFYPTKPLGGAEGGALLDQQGSAEWVQVRLNAGVPGYGSAPRYGTIGRGHKANMTDVQAAFALEALEGLEGFRARTNEAWERLAWWCTPRGIRYRRALWPRYLFQLMVDRPVEELQEAFRARGVATGWHFPPRPWLSLPCHPLSRSEWRRLTEAMEAVLL